MKPELVCIGHIVKEMIYFPDAEQGPVLGSPPAYCSVAVARQGVPVGLVTKMGRDMPEELLEPFGAAGVDMAGVHRDSCTTTTELIYDGNGDKEIRYPSKADPISAADVPEGYCGCRLVYVCTMDNDVLPEDLGAVVALGGLSAVDLGGYGGVHMSKARRDAAESLADLACGVAKHFTIVKASDEDARTIFGRDECDASAQRLLECGPKVVVITAGPDGALVYTATHRWHVPTLATQVVDTTGAGDTFMAGFLCEYLRSGDPLASARWGCGTSAFVIKQSGGVRVARMPTREDVQRILELENGDCTTRASLRARRDCPHFPENERHC